MSRVRDPSPAPNLPSSRPFCSTAERPVQPAGSLEPMAQGLGDALAASGGLPLVQFNAAPGVIDLGWGQPDPDLLPVEELRLAADAAARRWGPDLYSYGFAQGPAPLIAWLSQRLGEVDGRAPDPDSIIVGAGASGALDMVVTLAAKPGDVALIESPTYHIAVKLLRDHG